MPIGRSAALLIALVTMACSFGAIASAGEALHIGERGGFLLGHASRCGVPDGYLEQPAKLIHELISGAADSPEEKASADQAFAEQFILSMITPGADSLLPSCPRVRREFARLTQHQAPKFNSGMSADIERTQSRVAKARLPAVSRPSQARQAQRDRQVRAAHQTPSGSWPSNSAAVRLRLTLSRK